MRVAEGIGEGSEAVETLPPVIPMTGGSLLCAGQTNGSGSF